MPAHVPLAGAGGAMLRYVVGVLAQRSWPGSFPYGTGALAGRT